VVEARSPIRVDRRSKTPAYLQIVEQVQGLVAAGVLDPGDQLPTVRRLASEARINFNTVARAYRILDEAGVISTEHGRGTYVVRRLAASRARRARGAALESLARDFLAAAVRLGGTPEEARAVFEKTTRESAGGRRPGGSPSGSRERKGGDHP